MLNRHLSFLVLSEVFHQSITPLGDVRANPFCLRLLLLQSLKVLLVVPHKVRFGGEEQIDIFQCSSSGFHVERPGGKDCEDIDGAEQV